MTCDYNTLKECWVGRAYSPDLVDDEFVKQILTETEEDLVGLSNILEGFGVTVKRPDYTNVDTTKRPQLLFPRHYLKKINGKLYVGSEERDIDNWLDLLDNRDPYITLDNLNAASIIKANCKVIIDANATTRERALYLKRGNPEIEVVYQPLSCRKFDSNKHTNGVWTIIKEGVIISTPSGANATLETLFPDWDILYLDYNDRDLKDVADSKKILWSPNQIPPEYRRWVGYSPETFFDVNCLSVDETNVLVTRYNKKVFDFLDKHGVTAHEVPFRHRYLWDGGLHSLTFDYYREHCE